MELGLRDRNVLVAGASRGIGLAIARAFLEEGSRVAMAARGSVALAGARDALGSEFGQDRVLGYVGDLSIEKDAHGFVATAKRSWGMPDIAVASAGTGRGRTGWEVERSDWEASFEANLTPAVRLAEAVLPDFAAAGRGSLIFVASIVGRERVGAPLPYSAAKAGLISYANGLAAELGARNVRVNCVAPGNVMVAGGSWDSKLKQNREKWRRYLETEVPLRRFGRAEEIAATVVFLASDRASFVTGACLVADGGQTRTI
jgi:3-oxoacyl-[acyl-carrier protein] reductase